VPGRHAARDGKQSTGPLALSASRAPGRNLGLGRESLFPPGLNLGPVIMSRSSQSNGCAKFPAEQNSARCPRATLALILIFSAPTHAPQRSRATPSADERERRERARGAALSPSPVCAPTIGWTRHRRVASMASLRVCSHRRGDERRLYRGSSPTQIHKRSAGEILGPTTCRQAVVGFYSRSPQIHNPWICVRR
jgi:hypothetical protein